MEVLVAEIRDLILDRDNRLAAMQEQLDRIETRLMGGSQTTTTATTNFPSSVDAEQEQQKSLRDAERAREANELEAAERAMEAERKAVERALEAERKATAARAKAERIAREREEAAREERLRREAEERRKAEEAQRKRDELDKNRHKRLEELLGGGDEEEAENSLFGSADKKRDTASLFD